MGDLEELAHVFADTWDWSTAGEEWSTWWGGTPALWYGSILPRLHPYLPAARALEIAPGYGRITQFLKDQCEQLTLVDLAPKCIEACRARFADETHIRYHVNDGTSLAMIEDESLDLAFSWDSLVHADLDVLTAYVEQLPQKLSPAGVAFIHHSNVGQHRLAHQISMRLPERVRRAAVSRGVALDVYAWRAPDVDYARIAEIATRAGLMVVSQEAFPWERGRYLTDTISVLARPESGYCHKGPAVRNRDFRKYVHQIAALYGDATPPASV